MTHDVSSSSVPSLQSHVLQKVIHGFFTRQGGVSQGFYDSLNCSLYEGDPEENVRQNRFLALQSLSLEFLPLSLVKQVHGKDVLTVDTTWSPGALVAADAIVTTRADVVLGIQTADCVPVLLADLEHSVIGVAHAGWRGAVQGAVQETLSAMEVLGAQRHSIVAAIGPAIAQESYEVGEDLYEQVVSKDFLSEKFFKTSDDGLQKFFDLPGYVESLLTDKGVLVERLPYDTYDNEDLFFSCRRAYHQQIRPNPSMAGQRPQFGGHLSLISLARLGEHP